MNVWIENPFDNLPPEGYRPQRYWMMAEAFAAAGHRVTYFTSDFSHAHKRPRQLANTGCRPAFALKLLSTPPYKRNVSWARLASHREYARRWANVAATEIAEGNWPELIIASMPPLATCAVALDLRARCDCRVIFDIQDAWPETFIRLFPRGLKWLGRIILYPLTRIADHAYHEADMVTGVSEAYRQLACRGGARRYCVFPLGIMRPRQAVARRNGLRLVYAGNLGKGYDLGTVIRAVTKLPEATLDIAGAGEREGEWRRLAGNNPRVRFHGYLSQEELRQLLSRCSVGVIPMRDDSYVGLPNKLADYAASGIVTVSSLSGVCAEILKKYRLGSIYAWEDENSLISELSRLDELQPDFEGLLDYLDAARIYPAYVDLVTAG